LIPLDIMEEVLDNPVWYALNSTNKKISAGDDQVKYFLADISPFAGLKEINKNNLVKLFKLLPARHTVAIESTVEIEIPEPWKQISILNVFQMVFQSPGKPIHPDQEFTPLTYEHVPQMLSLATLTNPGPFSKKTIEFGDYFGIFQGNDLVAMCGQRLQPDPYIEVSAVCTHPDHLGKGYAGKLIIHQVSRIMNKSGKPFLHVLTSNTRAISLYEKLGFVTRKEMIITILQK